MDFTGKVALVTGGAKGMGASHCRLMAERGAAVIVADVDPAGEQLAAELRATGADARFVHLDVTREADWKAVVDGAMKSHGKVDILVNNAGVVVLKNVRVSVAWRGRTQASTVKAPLIWSVWDGTSR